MSDQFPPKEVIEKIHRDIEKRHKEMAKLSIEEKIKCLVSIQRMVSPILKNRGEEIRVWTIDEKDD